MRFSNEKREALFIVEVLKTLLTNTVNLEEYLKNQLLPFAEDTEQKYEELTKLLKKFKKSLTDSLEKITECRISNKNETWYNLKDCYNLKDWSNVENVMVENICVIHLLDELFRLEIGSFYHILKINMIKFDQNQKYQIKRRIFDKKEVTTYFRRKRFSTIHSKIMSDIFAPRVDLGILLGEDIVREWSAFLEDSSWRYERMIKRIIKKTKIAYTP